MSEIQKTEFIDMTPNWSGIMPALMAVLEDGTETGKKEVRAELMRLAAEVDRRNAAGKWGRP